MAVRIEKERIDALFRQAARRAEEGDAFAQGAEPSRLDRKAALFQEEETVRQVGQGLPEHAGADPVAVLPLPEISLAVFQGVEKVAKAGRLREGWRSGEGVQDGPAFRQPGLIPGADAGFEGAPGQPERLPDPAEKESGAGAVGVSLLRRIRDPGEASDLLSLPPAGEKRVLS